MPKSPFFPKFVDPKMMISKKTDMLSNLFGGLGPVAYTPDTKPITTYGVNETPLINSADVLTNKKRDIMPSGKEKIIGSSGMYKRGMFGPFTPSFGPKFGPFSTPTMMSDYTDEDTFSRKRRRIGLPSSDVNTILENKSGIADSASLSYLKESKIGKRALTSKAGSSSTPKEYLPGMFGSVGPFGPVVDPTMFTSKKSAFLDTLFKNIATSTPATTDTPVPKSTIVPPSYWMPSSIISDPTEYTSKVSDFLDKLFDSIKLNATVGATDGGSDAKSDFMRSLKPDSTLPDKIARSLEDLSSISTARDTIVDTILSELSSLKNNMITTLNDLIAYEKTASAAATTAKKPFKPFPGLWPKPTIDPTLPFQQRMDLLSQVFDMLTDLQRNITAVTKDAIMAETTTSGNMDSSKIPLPTNAIYTDASPINTTLLNAILKKLSTFDIATPVSYPTDPISMNSVMTRTLPKDPTPFWMSPYLGNTDSGIKRRQIDDSLSYLDDRNDDIDRHDRRQYTRGVKMQLHQGYQNLPAGSVESVEAGGGSTQEHQGGQIQLLVSMKNQ